MPINTSRQPRTKPGETHYKNTYFSALTLRKMLTDANEKTVSPSPIAMLFVVTQEAAKPKQHCTRLKKN